MSKRKLFTVMLLLLALALTMVACGSTEDLQQQVEEAGQQVEQAAEEAVAEAEDAMEEEAPAVEEPAEEAEAPAEEPAAEEPAAEEPAAEEPAAEEPAADMGYDMDIYGNIGEIDLDGTEVVFWHRYDSGSRQEEIDRLIAEFNATNEYGITVIGDPVGHYGAIYDKMIAGLTTGDVPGLVVAYQNQAAAYQVADGLVSVDPYIASPTYGLGDDKADFFEAFLASDRLPQFGGQMFGFPAAGRSMEMLFVNNDWLAELGYDAPPQTPEEFAEMACAAAAQPFSKNESDFSTGLEMDTDASVLAALVFARGGNIFDYENGQFTYNTEEAIAATTMMQQLYNDGCITQIAEKYGDQTDFGNGKTLFTTSSSSGLPYYASAVADGEVGGFDWSVAPIPYTGAEPMQNLYGGSVSIVKTDPVTQLASWLFLKYWTEPANQATWAIASNYFPARYSTADELSDYMAENEAYGTAFELLPYSQSEAPVAGYDNVRDAVEEAFIAIVFDGADPAGTLADLEAQANEIMAESAP
jgi:ABC-type glycerol-3-phosphate transport system substrate-binding protein